MSHSETISASPAVRISTALLVDTWNSGHAGGRDSEAAADAVLMARIIAGDQAAFHSFAQRHVTRFLAVALRLVGNGSDAEEIVQDALLRIWLGENPVQEDLKKILLGG